MPLLWVWELEETQPKSSQYQAENPVLSLGKLTREASNFMAKGFPLCTWRWRAHEAGERCSA